jgi:hypothetical protein
MLSCHYQLVWHLVECAAGSCGPRWPQVHSHGVRQGTPPDPADHGGLRCTRLASGGVCCWILRTRQPLVYHAVSSGGHGGLRQPLLCVWPYSNRNSVMLHRMLPASGTQSNDVMTRREYIVGQCMWPLLPYPLSPSPTSNLPSSAHISLLTTYQCPTICLCHHRHHHLRCSSCKTSHSTPASVWVALNSCIGATGWYETMTSGDGTLM